MPKQFFAWCAIFCAIASAISAEEPRDAASQQLTTAPRVPSRLTLGFYCADTRKGVTVVAIDPTDWAPRQEVLEGDVLVSIGGIAVDSAADVGSKVLPSLKPFKPTAVELLRSGRARSATIIPVAFIPLADVPIVVRVEPPQLPKRRIATSAAAAVAAGDMNVLTHVCLDPATRKLEFIGSYDTRFRTGDIPYRDLLRTALAHPNPQFSMTGISDDKRRVELMQEMIRQETDPYSVYGESDEGRYAMALLYGHPTLSRERQQFIRQSSLQYGLTPQDFIRLHTFFFVTSEGRGVPAGVAESMAVALRHTGYDDAAVAWLLYSTRPSPESYREALTLLGREESQIGGSLQVQALLAIVSTLSKYPVMGASTWANRWRSMLTAVQAGQLEERVLVASIERALLPRLTHDGSRDLYRSIVESLRFSEDALHLLRLFPSARVQLFTRDLPRDSQLARIMYEADFHLKSFDNFPELFEGVARYRPFPVLDDRPDFSVCWQPKKVPLKVSQDRHTVAFGQVEMEIRFDYGKNMPTAGDSNELQWQAPKLNTDPEHLFPAYFTEVAKNMDDFATVIPSFHELREVAKVIALARWLNSNGLRVDFSGYEQTPWVPPAFINREYIGRLEYKGALSEFELKLKKKSWGGVTFRLDYDWVASRIDPEVSVALPPALSLSNDLGQQAAQAAIDGNLESARNLAELSAQAMTGALTRQELSRLLPTVSLTENTSVPVSPRSVSTQKLATQRILREIMGVPQNAVPSSAVKSALVHAKNVLHEVRTNPDKVQDGAFLVESLTDQPQRRSATGVVKNNTRVALVAVPAVGRNWLGSAESEKGRKNTENPVVVDLSQPFLISMTEITQRQFREVMGTTPWAGQPYGRNGEEMPATWITWNEAMRFCEQLTDAQRIAGECPAGERFRLPTEAEWECACRAGTTTAYGFGERPTQLGEYAWFKENAQNKGQPFAHKVATKRENLWGLHDMHGNVMEWCSDWYSSELTGGMNPQGPHAGTMRVCRGGSWGHDSSDCRSASRFGIAPGERSGFIGFRVVRTQQ